MTLNTCHPPLSGGGDLIKKTMITELKKDKGKPKFHLLPLADMEEVVRVYELGCEKYEENSWRLIEPTDENINRILSALIRHIAEYQEKRAKGEEAVDEESGLHTVAHIAWNAIMLNHLEREKNETDKSNE